MDVARKYGMSGLTLAPEATQLAGASNGAMTGDGLGLLDPDNPLLWLLGIAGVTLGLIAFNGSVKFGPVHASAGVGK